MKISKTIFLCTTYYFWHFGIYLFLRRSDTVPRMGALIRCFQAKMLASSRCPDGNAFGESPDRAIAPWNKYRETKIFPLSLKHDVRWQRGQRGERRNSTAPLQSGVWRRGDYKLSLSPGLSNHVVFGFLCRRSLPFQICSFYFKINDSNLLFFALLRCPKPEKRNSSTFCKPICVHPVHNISRENCFAI